MEAPEPTAWALTMREKLKKAEEFTSARPWETWCIYQLTRGLRDAQDPKFYVPTTVSIGPYHYSNDQVQSMNRWKWVILNKIMKSTSRDLNKFFDSIKEVEEQARGCYHQDLSHLSSDLFVELMVLDGCFILEIFSYFSRVWVDRNVDVFYLFNIRQLNDILLDMILLENQIPLFILDRLLALIPRAYHKSDDQRAVVLALNIFSPTLLTGVSMSTTELEEVKSSLKYRKCLHLLDVCRHSLLHHGSKQNPIHEHKFKWNTSGNLLLSYFKRWNQAKKVSKRKAQWGVIYTVTELRDAGLKFRKQRNTNPFWAIKFKKGILEIPPILIHNGTYSIILNLATFENCHWNTNEAVIATYVGFMKCLIKSPEEVSYLRRCGIIQHLLSDDAEVVNLFRKVSKNMLVDVGGYHSALAKKVNEYCNRRRNKWRLNFTREN